MELSQSSYLSLKSKTEQLLPELLENDDSVVQSVAETSFNFSYLQIDANHKPKMEQLLQSTENDVSVDQLEAKSRFDCSSLQIDAELKPETEQLIPELTKTDDSLDQLAAEIQVISASEFRFDCSNFIIESNRKPQTEQFMPESPENGDYVDQSVTEINDYSHSLESDDEDEGEFTFICIGDNDSPNTELFESSQIQFPLFDQSLLSTGDNRLPITVPVDNVFIESPRRSNGETDGISTGTFCTISKDSGTGSPDINIKSNSTGFSKLWRFRDKMNRSNSDGRDAFVFFQTPDNGKDNGVSEVKGKFDENVMGNNIATSSTSNGKGNVKLTGKVVKEGKKKVKSAHAVYLKQKGGKTEEERRRSYLPYRPGLMGFFTNVNGGLSKNVHPF